MRRKKQLVILSFIYLFTASISAQVSFNDLRIDSQPSLLSFKDKLWFLGPVNSSTAADGQYNILNSDNNGESWNVISEERNKIAPFSRSIVFKDKIYSIGGHPKHIVNEVQYSEDGVNWTKYNGPFSPRRHVSTVVHNEKLFVIGGFPASSKIALNDVWYSEDGENWTLATNELSTDFPHFKDARTVSLNGKLVLFGGSRNDLGSAENAKGVYISEDEGKNWQRHEFPFDANLDRSFSHFVYDNRLYVEAMMNDYPTGSFNSQTKITRNRKYFFSTSDGINWKVETTNLDESLENIGLGTHTVVHNNKVNLFYNSDAQNGKILVWEEPKFHIKHIDGVVEKQTDNKEINITVEVEHYDPNFTGDIQYCFRSDKQEIIKNENLIFKKGTLRIIPEKRTGECFIYMYISDSSQELVKKFRYFNFPNGKVAWNHITNQRKDIGGTFSSFYFYLFQKEGYGNSKYSFKSSNESFLPSSELSNTSFAFFHKMDYGSFDTQKEGETQITIIASDGTSSDSTKYWIKVGEDLAPQLNTSLPNYEWDRQEDFLYNLPDNAFSDPEGNELHYSANNLACGLSINPKTGSISGQTDENLPFDIELVATDRYGKKASASFQVNGSNTTSFIQVLKDNNPIHIYPVPSKEYIQIESRDEAIQSIKIYNMNGALVHALNAVNKYSFRLEHSLDNGLYIVEIQSVNKQHRTKMIVNR